MKILVCEPIHEQSLAILRAKAQVVDWNEMAGADLHDVDGLIVRQIPITAAMMDRMPALRVIGSHGVGVDNIDVAEARRRGIAIVNVPFGTANCVAELAFALMLAVSRQLVPGMDAIRGNCARRGAPDQRGLELTGKALGIVGYGHIGARIGEIGNRGFGMSIHAYSRSLTVLGAPVGVCTYTSLTELFAACDYICICVPLTEQTRGMIGARELAACKPSAILVNCARGGVVDEAALFNALKAGQLFGAASDVFVSEPPRADNPLLSCPRFVASQHIGVNTEEALMRIGNSVASDVLACLQGKEPRYLYVGKEF